MLSTLLSFLVLSYKYMLSRVLTSSERNTDFLGYRLKCAKNVNLIFYNCTYFLSWTSILSDIYLIFVNSEFSQSIYTFSESTFISLSAPTIVYKFWEGSHNESYIDSCQLPWLSLCMAGLQFLEPGGHLISHSVSIHRLQSNLLLHYSPK